MTLASAALLAMALVSLGGCSTVEKLNPFGPATPKTKPTELSTIQATAELKSLWQASVGGAGEYVFSPAIVGDSVYAGARDGSLSRFDGGRQMWRVAAGQIISGGVGSDGSVVVVGSPKGEVLAFDAATGREAWKARVSSEVLAAPVVADSSPQKSRLPRVECDSDHPHKRECQLTRRRYRHNAAFPGHSDTA